MIGLVIVASMLAPDAQPSVPDAQTQIERAVQAMNDQLKRWSASIDSSGRLDTCKTIVSSGDPQLDSLACQAMSECTLMMHSITARLEDPAVAKADKEKLAREASGTATTCVATRRAELFRGLAERRKRAAEGKK
jgi:hypothetical protein